MAFLFRLETEDGAPAEPRQLTNAVPNWSEGDTIHLGKRTLRVIGKRDDEADSRRQKSKAHFLRKGECA
jgi:hypothetical protein